MNVTDHPDEDGHVEPDVEVQGPCSRCGRDDDDPIHDPFATGSGTTAAGHQLVPLVTERPEETEAAA